MRRRSAVAVRFGRYPERNAALGRAATSAEIAYLATGELAPRRLASWRAAVPLRLPLAAYGPIAAAPQGVGAEAAEALPHAGLRILSGKMAD